MPGDKMINFRMLTFMDLCKTKNYTKTAANLHITQPAVTQHIKYLENYYGAKLFTYSGRNLSLTKQGQLLEEFTSMMYADYNKMKGLIKSSLCKPKKIKFGATGTIGEYLMPNVIEKYLEYEQNEEFMMIIDNTENLLGKIKNGDIDFAIIDGYFQKSDYECTLLFKEPTVAVCAVNHRLAKGPVAFDDLLTERLILREEGSEGRYNLGLLLREKNLSIESFSKTLQIGHWNVTKDLVQKGLGIAFLYRNVVKRDIENNLLAEIKISDFNVTREINFVWLKGSFFTEERLHFLDYCKRFINIS